MDWNRWKKALFMGYEKSTLPGLQKKQVHFHSILEKCWGNPSSEHQDAAAQPRVPACFALLPGGAAPTACNGGGGGHGESPVSLGFYLGGNKLVKMLSSGVSAANWQSRKPLLN